MYGIGMSLNARAHKEACREYLVFLMVRRMLKNKHLQNLLPDEYI